MGLIVKKKVWVELDGKPLLGQGRYNLLKSIEKTNSLKKSAAKIGICEKTAYNYIKRIEVRFGKSVIESHKGGKNGGGKVMLLEEGKKLMRFYENASK